MIRIPYVLVFFKQKTAYEMRISDWSSDVCSSDLAAREVAADLVYEGFEPLRCQRAAGMVVFCEWYLDRQLEADEQRQRLENDLGVAIDPADRLRHAIEPAGKAVLQLRGPAPVEPGGDRIGEDGRLRGSWLDRKSVVEGKGGSVRVDRGGRGIVNKTNKREHDVEQLDETSNKSK